MLQKTKMVTTIQKNFSGNSDVEKKGVCGQREAVQKGGPKNEGISRDVYENKGLKKSVLRDLQIRQRRLERASVDEHRESIGERGEDRESHGCACHVPVPSIPLVP